MGNIGEPWVSDKLASLLGKLSPQQAAGVRRIVDAELRGVPITPLLDCPGQICTSTTFYGSGKTHRGWRNKPDFQAALLQAREDYRSWLLEHGAQETLVLLTEAGPPAAVELRRQATGDVAAVDALGQKLDEAVAARDEEMVRTFAYALGISGVSAARLPLERALLSDAGPWEPKTYQVLAEALATIARAMDADRQKAAMGILDRIDKSTASKAPAPSAGPAVVVYIPDNGRNDRTPGN